MGAMGSFSRFTWLLMGAMASFAGCAAKQKSAEQGAAAGGPGAAATSTVTPAPQVASGLYSADEALRDALSGPLEYVGSGPWPEVERLHACVFRNQRVVVVNAYCTQTESSVFRIDVYSPAGGHVRIYAEGKGPVSAQMRQSYFTFKALSEPPLDPGLSMRPLTLSMSFSELRDYDQKRYEAFLPACYGGTELDQPLGGCLGSLATHAAAWSDQHRAFLRHASDDWYSMMREMRRLASQYGKDIEQEEDDGF